MGFLSGKNLLRALVLLLALGVGACGRVPKAPSLARESGYLGSAATRQLVTHWAGSGYPEKVSGHQIQVVDRHRLVRPITGLTPAESISRGDPDQGHLGTVAMLETAPPDGLIPITRSAWLIGNQPATVVAEVTSPGTVELSLHDFRAQATLDGRTLAQNHQLPFDAIRKTGVNRLARLRTFIDPLASRERRGFYLATPYDRDKIPLIFIHGLLSTPVDFQRMAAGISAESDLWERYQLWFYFYPSGDPWVASAASFRSNFTSLVNHLDPENDDRPLRTETTLIAHSMGGLISRLSLSENSQLLYQQYFNRPLDDLRLLPAQKKSIHRQLLFEPLAEPARIIFLATPHEGAQLASGPLLWLSRALVKAPARVLGSTIAALQALAFAEPALLTPHGSALLAGNQISVSGLSPGSPPLLALNQMPLRRGVRLDNIVATLTGTERGLGDWVVPFKSASLKEADSEIIVRSGHWLIRDPETIETVIDLLRK